MLGIEEVSTVTGPASDQFFGLILLPHDATDNAITRKGIPAFRSTDFIILRLWLNDLSNRRKSLTKSYSDFQKNTIFVK